MASDKPHPLHASHSHHNLLYLTCLFLSLALLLQIASTTFFPVLFSHQSALVAPCPTPVISDPAGAASETAVTGTAVSASISDEPRESSQRDEREVEKEMLRLAENTYKAHLRARRALKGAMQPGIKALTAIEASGFLTPTYPCPAEHRIGQWTDGGKWLCSLGLLIPPNPIVYSIGSKGEFSFERGISETFNATTFTYDPFINGTRRHAVESQPFIKYFPVGLAAASEIRKSRAQNPGMRFSTIAEMMARNGHTRIDVFKVDCEGCEEEVVREMRAVGASEHSGDDLDADGLPVLPLPQPPIAQILMEFHHGIRQTIGLIYHLERIGYRMFHVEPNLLFRKCTEISFIHESIIGHALSA